MSSTDNMIAAPPGSVSSSVADEETTRRSDVDPDSMSRINRLLQISQAAISQVQYWRERMPLQAKISTTNANFTEIASELNAILHLAKDAGLVITSEDVIATDSVIHQKTLKAKIEAKEEMEDAQKRGFMRPTWQNWPIEAASLSLINTLSNICNDIGKISRSEAEIICHSSIVKDGRFPSMDQEQTEPLMSSSIRSIKEHKTAMTGRNGTQTDSEQQQSRAQILANLNAMEKLTDELKKDIGPYTYDSTKARNTITESYENISVEIARLSVFLKALVTALEK